LSFLRAIIFALYHIPKRSFHRDPRSTLDSCIKTFDYS